MHKKKYINLTGIVKEDATFDKVKRICEFTLHGKHYLGKKKLMDYQICIDNVDAIICVNKLKKNTLVDIIGEKVTDKKFIAKSIIVVNYLKIQSC